MARDLAYEAAYLRAALLLGLEREADVIEWAEQALAHDSARSTAFADLVLAPAELSALREALWPLARDVDASRTLGAVMAGLALAGAQGRLDAPTLLRSLTLARHEFRISGEILEGIRAFDARAMLAHNGVPGATAPTLAELVDWLDRVRRPAVFRVDLDRKDDVRHATTASEPTAVILSETDWLAAAERGPMSVSARIPFVEPHQ